MYRYRIVINKEPVRCSNKYLFEDSNKTEIYFNKQGIIIDIEYKTSTLPSINKIIEKCKKASLLYLWEYSYINELVITNVTEVNHNKNVSELFNKLNKEFYINDINMLRNNISKDIYPVFLKSKTSSPIYVMLQNYTMYCLKESATECFLYAWMAFNSIYNVLRTDNNIDNLEYKLLNRYVKDFIDRDIKYKKSDSTKLKKYVYGVISKICIEDLNSDNNYLYNKVANYVYEVFSKSNNNYCYEDYYNYNKELFGKIFLLIDIAYFYRCNLFHGSYSADVFFKNEKETKLLYKLSDLITDELMYSFDKYIDLLNR